MRVLSSVSPSGLTWFGIVRLGLVQTALGAIIVLTTTTMNRVMVVELALPAMLPGALVGIHYAIQILRPRWGYGSDEGRARTPWIVGGMATLAVGGLLAAIATALMATSTWAGIALSVLAFALVGAGVGAAGTSLLVLIATTVAPRRRAAAATIDWGMMIAGFIVTAATAGSFLDPFSMARLVAVTATVSAAAFVLSVTAVAGLERRAARIRPATAPDADPDPDPTPDAPRQGFREALAEILAERQARRFAVFVFVSMLAYSAQDLILEPFAGTVFGLTPGESTKLGGVQYQGVLLGMIAVGLAGSAVARGQFGSLKLWTLTGCVVSAAMLFALAVGGTIGDGWPLALNVFGLGVGNGIFAVAAIGSMMGLADEGRKGRAGTRMGLWGAAQAIAFGIGGFLGTAAVDGARAVFASPVPAYASVFAAEALAFLVAAWLAARVTARPARPGPTPSDSIPRPDATAVPAALSAR